MTITKELIESLKSDKGAYKSSVLHILGVSWPPLSGWPRRIEGNYISKENYELALKLKNTRTKIKNIEGTIKRAKEDSGKDLSLEQEVKLLKDEVTEMREVLDFLHNEIFPNETTK